MTAVQFPRRLDLSRRQLLAGFAVVATVTSVRAIGAQRPSGPITPEQFGAVGDGKTNDTAAFAKMTAYINHQGGGEVALRSTTYLVGEQRRNPKEGYAYYPASIMDFVGCAASLVIHGNGAVIRCADGLRFGTFDPDTGQPTQHSLPYYGMGERSSPYTSMLSVTECAGQVLISDLEFDGNVAGLLIGGPWGDTGWQIACCGLRLQNNTAAIQVTNVKSHHHAQDGGVGDGLGVVGSPEMVSLENCEFVSNARNAWSMVGGVGWTFSQCRFDKSALALPFPGSMPMAGIDFEAEGGKYVADIHLVDCSAQDNVSAGCLHPGDSMVSNVVWEGGQIIGSKGWSYYGGGNDGIVFKGVTFLGALVNLTKERFENCTFSDEVSRSPSGQLYNPTDFMLLVSPTSTNSFERCSIIHSTPGVSISGSFDQALYENCAFYSLSGAGRLDIYGHFRGTETRFVAESGGTDFQITPDGLGGFVSAGHAEDPFTITTSDGSTTTYTPPASA